MNEITSPVSIDIFDTLAQQVPRDLADNEMTVDRFAAKYNTSTREAKKVLLKAVRDGTLTKQRRLYKGLVVPVYLPV